MIRNLPDARGVFLRCKNHGRNDGRQNPDGDLNLGDYQEDGLRHHGHAGDVAYPNRSGDAKIRGCPVVLDGPSCDVRKFGIDGTGGNETRPRNITVNAFVKVRESASAHHHYHSQAQISAEWVAQLFQSAEFLQALREFVTATLRSKI